MNGLQLMAVLQDMKDKGCDMTWPVVIDHGEHQRSVDVIGTCDHHKVICVEELTEELAELAEALADTDDVKVVRDDGTMGAMDMQDVADMVLSVGPFDKSKAH
jgi:hypothetical protein